jgi:tetratricopeptide (TPR) repeat protein
MPTQKTKAAGADISALSGDPAGVAPQPAERSDRTIGLYQLLELLGRGGMGEVWLAEQMHPVRRRVALKLIKAGMDTGEVVARFQSERQALALMDHPTIAKVFDAGSTPQGRPYFAMEYIVGVPITEYCDRHKSTVRERLELFIQVCEGVQHAHQKAVIHRDLKPSNILVSEVDGKPVPRLIDFGVAKALAHGVTGESLCTQVGAIVGTPQYMSPEQAGVTGVDVDTRSDVYSLGAVLYELLVGVRPLELHGLPFDEMLRRLREDEPPPPSTKARQLRGDLDAIVLKALEKDRSRRYGSPSDLAADIERYLRNEAVLAVPPSAAYRARKFARRYRGPLITAGAVALVLVAAAVFSIRQSIRANSEATVAHAVNDFLQNDLLAQAGTHAQWGRGDVVDPDLKVRTVLDRAAAGIAGKFGRQPEVEASIRDTIGQAYIDLGPEEKAQRQMERAVDLYRRVLGAEDPKTLRAGSLLAEAICSQGRYPEAENVIGPFLKIQRRVLGPDHPDTLHSMYTLAKIQRNRGRFPQAESLLSQILQASGRILGLEDSRTLDCMDRLAEVYYREGKYRQAEALGVRVLDLRRRVLGPEHPDTTVSMSDLANVYDAQGRFAQAEAIYRQTLDIRRRTLGPEHGLTLGAANNLAEVYRQQGRYAQAEALDKRLLEIRRRTLGSETSDALLSMENLADDYSCRAKYPQAEALFAQTLAIDRRVLGPESWVTLAALSDAAFMCQREGKYASAENYAAEVLAAWRHNVGLQSPVTMDAAADLALVYVSQAKFAQSELLAREAVQFDRKNRPDDWQRFRAESLLGASLAGKKKFAEAEPLLVEGYKGMLARKERMPVFDWYYLDLVHKWLLRLYRAWGKPQKAAELRKK